MSQVCFGSMPSWPSRLLLGASAPSHDSPAPPSLECPPHKHGQQKMTSRREAPISASTPTSSSSSRNRPVIHSRSLSHPFTSSLSEDRRAHHRLKGRNGCDGVETTTDGSWGISSTLPKAQISTSQSGPLQHAEKELVTGKCATCGSLVRWPKDADVFRCTICLMVSDLSPASKATLAADAPEITADLSRGKLTRPASIRKGTL